MTTYVTFVWLGRTSCKAGINLSHGKTVSKPWSAFDWLIFSDVISLTILVDFSSSSYLWHRAVCRFTLSFFFSNSIVGRLILVFRIFLNVQFGSIFQNTSCRDWFIQLQTIICICNILMLVESMYTFTRY